MFIPYRVDVPFNHRPVANRVICIEQSSPAFEMPAIAGNAGDYWA